MTVKAEDPAKKANPREFFIGGGPTEPVRITGSVTAIDVTTGKEAGKLETPYPMLGGVLATPDLVFSSQPDGKVARSTPRPWRSCGASTPAAASARRR